MAIARIRRLGWRRVLPFLAVLAVTTGIPLSLTSLQYSLISGWSDLQSYWFSKLTFRTGSPRYASGGLGFTNILAWLNILVNYIGGYLPFLVLAVWLARRQRKKRSASVYSPVMTDAILLSLVPVILHHAVFFNFTSVHDFSVLKSAGVLAILTGLLYHKSLSGRPLKREPALWLGLVAFAVIQFWLINVAGSHSRYRIAGDFIRRESQPDEVVFVTGLPLPADPQYLAYARRNMAGWSGPGQAAELLRKNRTERGVLFSFGADSSVLKTERFVMTNGKIQFKDDR